MLLKENIRHLQVLENLCRPFHFLVSSNCSDHSYFAILGMPVDRLDDIDNVPTIFAYKLTQHNEGSERQREERTRRLDKRRQVHEDTEREIANQDMAVEGLLLLQEAKFKHDSETQTSVLVADMATQTDASDGVVNVSTQIMPVDTSTQSPRALISCYLAIAF